MNLGQKLGIGLGSTALAIGGIFGATQAAHYYSASAQTQTQSRGGMQGGPGGQGGMPGQAPGAQSSAGTTGQAGTSGSGTQSGSGTSGTAPTGAAPTGAAPSGAPTGAAPAGAAPNGAAPTGAAGGAGQGVPTELVSTVASTFNLSTDKVQTALDAAFTSVQSQNLQPGDEMDAAIAKKAAASLNVDETKLKDVLVKYRASMQNQQPGAASGNG